MTFLYQMRHPFHRRRARSGPSGPATTGTVIAAVAWADADRFLWTFSEPFDDSGSGDWHSGMFADLLVGGFAPNAIDEIDGAAGTIVLDYGEAVYEPGLPFAVEGSPDVLIFPGAQQLIVPQSGTVSP